MQVETSVAGSHIEFMALDISDDVGFHAVERQIEPAISRGGERESKFALTDRPACGTVAVSQAYLLLRPLPVAEREHPLPPAHRHPARGSPWRMRLGECGVRFLDQDRRH